MPDRTSSAIFSPELLVRSRFWPRKLLTEASFGAFSFGQAGGGAISLVQFSLFYALLFLVVAVTEESLFRGYGLVELSRAISFWPAAIFCSVLFGLPHWLKGEGETIIGGIQAGLFSLALAYAFRRTGSLWFGIGVHAGWDYGETFIFGVPNSALKLDGSILHPAIEGPNWLNGGAAGPEGSVLAILPVLGLFLAAWLLGRRQRPSPAANLLPAGAVFAGPNLSFCVCAPSLRRFQAGHTLTMS